MKYNLFLPLIIFAADALANPVENLVEHAPHCK